MTNGDKVRAMDDDELAEFTFGRIGDCYYCPLLKESGCVHRGVKSCKKRIKKWLESEAE